MQRLILAVLGIALLGASITSCGKSKRRPLAMGSDGSGASGGSGGRTGSSGSTSTTRGSGGTGGGGGQTSSGGSDGSGGNGGSGGSTGGVGGTGGEGGSGGSAGMAGAAGEGGQAGAGGLGVEEVCSDYCDFVDQLECGTHEACMDDCVYLVVYFEQAYGCGPETIDYWECATNSPIDAFYCDTDYNSAVVEYPWCTAEVDLINVCLNANF